MAIVQFDGERLVHEHIYWDQASVLAQIGMLDPRGCRSPAQTARKVADRTLPSNALMQTAWRKSEGKPV